jgi:hypothetical protein
VIALNYLDPICVDGDGCPGLPTYATDIRHAHITLTDDPDPAESGKLLVAERLGPGAQPLDPATGQPASEPGTREARA